MLAEEKRKDQREDKDESEKERAKRRESVLVVLQVDLEAENMSEIWWPEN